MDTLSPTLERIAHAHHGVDEPEITQAVQRRAHYVRDIWDAMRERGTITPEEQSAGKRFASHFETAYKGRSVTPSYGQRHAEGTPISQQSGDVQQDSAARHVDYVTLHKEAKSLLPPSARMAMMMAVDGATLTQIGKVVGGLNTPNRAITAATAYLKTALELLTSHYGMFRQRDP